jgi:hypothetical protein
MDAIDKLLENNHKQSELHRMAYAKENAIHFNKWLFDNHFAPNQSFFWFDYTLSREYVRFFKLEELYDTYKRSLAV